MDLHDILRYSVAAQDTLYDFMGEHEPFLNKEFVTVSPFNSIGKIMAHMIGAEKRWVAGLQNQPRPPRYEDNPPQELVMLRADALAIRTQLNQILDLGHRNDILNFVMQSGDKVTMSRSEMTYHIFNHESFHRGNISMALQRFGIEPPGFDLPALILNGKYQSQAIS